MRSTFMGLEASKKGLFVQQSALYTTGHNISNANTDGYSRQRVNMAATSGYPHAGLNSPTYPGHLGTGVEASSVQRIRDEFIDRQYRQETNKLGYWESTLNSINQMEDILSEPSEFGINQSFNDFWKALEDISTNPEDTAARKVALAKAEALADAFNYNYTQLETIQGNIGNEISVTTTEINSLLKQIAAINAQVQAVEPNGYVTNDLYDARDLLVDKLNELIPVSIERVPSGGNASSVAEGSLTVYFKPANSNEAIILVHGDEHAEISVNDQNGQITAAEPHDSFAGMQISWMDATPPTANDLAKLTTPNAASPTGATYEYGAFETSKGKLLALIDSYGYTDAQGNIKGTYPEMLANLDKLATTFMNAFNTMHKNGFTLGTAAVPSTNGGDLFGGTGVKDLQVLISDPKLLAASSGAGEEGNGKWAIELANLQFLGMNGKPSTILGNTINFSADSDLDGATFQSFYKGIIGDLAVAGQEAARLEYNSGTLLLTIENNRASMSSVSLDEEMTNMITFQQAYNANARMITVVDETLDKIINGMGRVGL